MQQAKAPENECYVDTQSAARLMGVTPRAIRKSIGRSKLSSAKVTGQGGAGGIAHLIPISELPMEAQLRHHQQAEGVNAQSADLAAYRERYGEAGLEKVMARLRAVQEMQLLRGDKRSAQRRAEIAEAMGVKPRCIYDWERKYEAEGLEGLMDKTMRSDKGKPRCMCLLAQDRVNYLYMAPGKLSQNRVHKNLVEMRDKLGSRVCEECCHNPESYNRQDMLSRGQDPGEECRKCGEGLLVPDTRYALNRYITTLDRAVLTLGRYGEKPFDDLYMPKCRRDKPEQVNAVWFGDHHIFDVFVDVGNGKAARPWLTAWMDACSGCIVGWAISLNPNSDTIIESLALGIQKTKGSEFWGIPQWIYIDNGKDYRCKRIEGDGGTDYEPGRINIDASGDNALLKTLGIGVTHAIPYRARSKTIERVFGLIEGQWIRGLPGYCGNGSDPKPENIMADIRGQKLRTLEEFVAYWVNIVLPKYHAYKATPKDASPLEIYRSHEKARLEIPAPAILALAKSQLAERVIRPDGIYLRNQRYWDNALAERIGQRVKVRYSRGEAASISVLDEGGFVCEAVAADNFQLIGEDAERLSDHLAMQARTRKEKLAALRLPADRVRFLDTMATEVPDLAQTATITSMVHERAWRGKQEALEREKRKQEGRQRASGTIRARQEAAGSALLDLPDAN